MAKTLKEQILDKQRELNILSLTQKLVEDEAKFKEQTKKTQDEIKKLKGK